jgi:hypothetical protein
MCNRLAARVASSQRSRSLGAMAPALSDLDWTAPGFGQRRANLA